MSRKVATIIILMKIKKYGLIRLGRHKGLISELRLLLVLVFSIRLVIGWGC